MGKFLGWVLNSAAAVCAAQSMRNAADHRKAQIPTANFIDVIHLCKDVLSTATFQFER